MNQKKGRMIAARAAVCFLLCCFASAQTMAQTGQLEGRVVEASTNEPLPGATVVIDSLRAGAITDSTGAYLIKDLPYGIYSVKASYYGYAPVVKNQVFIEQGVTQANFALESAELTSDTITVRASAFAKTSDNLVSVRSIGVEQIRTNPGGNFDISRVVQSLPGVSGSLGFRNDVIVRGGAPNENVFYLDGVEVPNINHFATQGSGGGPVGIINSTFIENVTFQSSAFGARYDNALSSVLDFDMISGNSERFQTTLLVSGTEAGVTFDTPIGNKVTALLSVRRSYLQLLFQLIDLPFLPDYWDVQGKLQYNINPKTTLTYVRLGAIDRFSLNEPEDVDPEQLYILDGLPVYEQDSYTQGLVLKRLTKDGFFTIAASRNRLDNRANKTDSTGAVDLDFNSTEAENKLRLNFKSLKNGWEIGYGGVFQYATFRNETFSVQFLGEGIDTLNVDSRINVFRYGAYGSVSRRYLNRRLWTTFGIRTDMNSFTDRGNNPLEALSPRASLRYTFSPKWSAAASTGIYYKLPPYTILGFSDAEGNDNRNARYIQSTHFVAGAEYQPSDSWLFSLETFLKLYDRYPVSVNDSVSLANLGGNFDVFGNEDIQSVGKGRAYGAELFVQKTLTKRLYGLASYTLYWSEFTGFNTEEYIRSAWDNRHLVSLTGGYLFGKKNNWEFAAKWRFLGGAPYTPFDIDASVEYYQVAGVGVPDFDRLNREQTSAFSQVDVRLERRWYFKKWSMILFIDIQNLLDTENPGQPNFTLQRTDDNSAFVTPAQPVLIDINQSSRIPSIGIRVKI